MASIDDPDYIERPSNAIEIPFGVINSGSPMHSLNPMRSNSAKFRSQNTSAKLASTQEVEEQDSEEAHIPFGVQGESDYPMRETNPLRLSRKFSGKTQEMDDATS